MNSATARSVKTCKAGPGAARRRAGEPLGAPAPAGSLLHLQRTAGNQAVGTLLATPRPQLQAQLRIGQPGDAFEREADRVADAMAGPAAPRGSLPGISQIHGAGGGALRRCARCGGDHGAGESRGTPAGVAPGVVQRKCQCAQGKDDELMQRREAPGETPHVPAGFTAQLAGLRGGGAPLSPAQRSFFEPRFGHDFGAVRLHTGALAERSAEAVHARAFTLGNDVVFSRGEYAPDSPAGRHLLAHELTHVVQQIPLIARRQPLVQRAPQTADSDSAQAVTASKTPAKAGACTRRILAEGTCAHLACNSDWACCDPDHGIPCPGKTSSHSSTSCPSERWTPGFTCDHDCATSLERRCDDNALWMAVPRNQFNSRLCGQSFTICANGHSTAALVRDRSVTGSSFEVSPGVQTALGVAVGSTFQGAVYQPGAHQSAINQDRCCNSTGQN